MQVAVTQMPEAIDPIVAQLCQPRLARVDEVRDRAKRDRNIVATDGADASVCLGDVFADRPKIGTLASGLGDDPVGCQARIHSQFKQGG